MRLPSSFRPVVPAGKASAATRAETVRDTLTAEEASAPMEVQLPLRLRHAVELERRVSAGETISRQEMAARFLPEASDYQVVAGWLASQGLTVKPAGAARAVVIATGTVAQVEKAFEAHFARVKYREEEYTSSTVAPSVPTEIEARVGAIHGLQPHLHPRKSVLVTPAATSDGQLPYLVGDILNAYDVPAANLTGAGQTIGIIIDTLPTPTDLTAFWTANGVPQSLSNYSTVNVENRAIGAPTGEETLDVEWSSGIASGASIVVYACGDLNDVNDCYSRVLDDLQAGAQPNLHQISMSYGAGEISDETSGDIQSVHGLFTSIAAYGVSLFAAAGDDGPYGNDEGKIEVVFPASDPLVTAVGGTSLYLSSSDVVTSETGWSVSGASNDHDSGGGGSSAYFDRPAWQVGTGVNTAAMRQIPDVALDANPDTGYDVYFRGKSEQDGGTSLSTPIWAGLCALVNQARATAGLAPLGVANVALYPALGTSGFRDITSGSDGLYSAGVGYDLMTGLGTPDFTRLLPSLLGITSEPAPAITSTLTASGMVGTAFTYQITASNSPASFAAAALPAGLSVDASTGLISGTPTAAGVSAVTLSAINTGGTGTATLTLTVAAATLPTVTLAATVPTVAVNSGAAGEFTLTIPSALSTDLIVSYTVKGSATPGADYPMLKGTAKIKAGKTSKAIKVVPEGDLGGASKKTVVLTLQPGTGYQVGTAGKVKVKLTD